MPAEKLRGNRHMGEERMRITVVGAVLILAAAIAVVLVARVLIEKQKRGSHQNETQSPPPGW